MTVRQAAERLEVSASTVYGLIAAGRLRHHRIGTGKGAIRIPDSAIEEFLKASEVSVINVPEKKKQFRHINVP